MVDVAGVCGSQWATRHAMLEINVAYVVEILCLWYSIWFQQRCQLMDSDCFVTMSMGNAFLEVEEDHACGQLDQNLHWILLYSVLRHWPIKQLGKFINSKQLNWQSKESPHHKSHQAKNSTYVEFPAASFSFCLILHVIQCLWQNIRLALQKQDGGIWKGRSK